MTNKSFLLNTVNNFIRKMKIPLKDTSPDNNAVKEEYAFKTNTADQRNEKLQLRKWLKHYTVHNTFILYIFLFASGSELTQFSLDPWVLVTLIGGITGSSTVYYWRRTVDYAYNP